MSENVCQHHHHHPAGRGQLMAGLASALAVIGLLVLINPETLATSQMLATGASLSALFGFGFLATISHCALLAGAILLTAVSYYQSQGRNKWLVIGVFQAGRVAAYALGGWLLGYLGIYLQLNEIWASLFMIVAAVLMIIFGLDFLEIFCWHHYFERSFGRLATFQPGWGWLFLVGAATFFVPCGFTSTAQLLALSSGQPTTGLLIMTAFVAGTVIPLSVVGLTGSWGQGDRPLNRFLKITIGWLIILLALLNLNEAMAELGWPHLEILDHHHGTLEAELRN